MGHSSYYTEPDSLEQHGQLAGDPLERRAAELSLHHIWWFSQPRPEMMSDIRGVSLTCRACCGLQRILKVEYEFPAHVKVSKECRDLLSHILVPDPASRITIPEIQRHPWYLKDLPPGVAEMNDNLPVPTTGMQVGHLSHLLLCTSPRLLLSVTPVMSPLHCIFCVRLHVLSGCGTLVCSGRVLGRF